MVKWLEEHMLTCFYKQTFGLDCPGCGMQRSIISLLKGDFAQSFLEHRLVFLKVYSLMVLFQDILHRVSFFLFLQDNDVVLLFVFSTIHILFNVKNGANIIKWIFIIASSSIFINFVYKIIFLNDICCAPGLGS